MSEPLRIALTKGRLQDKSVELFEAMGLDCSPIKDPGDRKSTRLNSSHLV